MSIDQDFFRWVDDVLAQEMPDSVVAYYFALYEGVKPEFHVQLVGASEYSQDDQDWACAEAFTTGENVFAIPRKVAGQKWQDGLAFSIGLVNKYLQTGQYRDAFKSKQAVGVGFVDGDIEIIFEAPRKERAKRAREASARAPFYKVGIATGVSNKSAGVVCFPEETPMDLLAPAFSKVANWTVQKATLKDGNYSDFLANDAGVRLMSEKLQMFIESHRAPGDSLQWLPVIVASSAEERQYYILHFSCDLQPLNKQATQWIGDSYPRVPVVRKELMGQNNVFGYQVGGYGFVVSGEVQMLLQKEFPDCLAYSPLSTA